MVKQAQELEYVTEMCHLQMQFPEASIVKHAQALAGRVPVLLSGKRLMEGVVKQIAGTVFPVSPPRQVGINLAQIARFLQKLCVGL